jgi:hypothetical protein
MNMERGLRRVAGVLILAGTVCACSKTPDATAPAPLSGAPEESFGPTFSAAFRAAPNSTPVTPTPSSVVPVNPTAVPVPIR